MSYFLIETIILWSLALGFYHAFLKRDTFWQVHRWYLLGALGWGLLQPFFAEYTPPISSVDFLLERLFVNANPVNLPNRLWTSSESTSWQLLGFGLLYCFGFCFFLYRFLKGLYKIKWLIHTGTESSYKSFAVIQSEHITQPFSFLHWIFLPAYTNRSGLEFSKPQNDQKWILEHEAEHLRRKHSIDLLFLETLGIFFWFFRPVLMLYKKELIKLHEYQADAAALHIADKKAYCHMLLQHSRLNRQAVPTHTFSSHLQNRFTMMLRPKSNKVFLLKHLLLIPALVFCGLMLSTFPSAAQEKLDGTEFKTVEEMPRFPGCENVPDEKERFKCSQDQMLAFIYQNIKYPEEARKKSIEGMVIISFVVEKDGAISHVQIVREIGGGCGEEAQRVVATMPKWIPGKQKGQPVRTQLNLPIKFKL